jgi:hypothetical protein
MSRPLLFAGLAALSLTACSDELRPVDVSNDGGNAVAAWEDAQGRRLESFEWGDGARNQVVDYVFVLDNSVSMRAVLDRVRKGFAGLQASDFPAETRIAVLTTLPADPDDLSELHPAVPPRILKHDAGFGRLVSGASIRDARRVQKLRRHYRLEGCGEDGWFSPGDTNAQGESCLVAHTQTTLMASQTEAGLTALDQLLQRNDGKPTFRPGAAVNVVFVSDTHDPGIGGRAAMGLIEDRPTPEALAQRIEKDNVVSSIRFHAIAPATECVERWMHFGPSYYDAAEYTGGAIVDMCTENDFQPILDRVFDEGARPTKPVFALGAKAGTVQSVRVDGQDASYEVHPNGRVVTVDLPTWKGNWRNRPTVTDQTIEIEYQRDIAPEPVTPAPTTPRFDTQRRNTLRKQRTLTR